MSVSTPCPHAGPSGLLTAEELHVIHEHIERLVDQLDEVLVLLEALVESQS